jgi:ascorbate-specific PTS system EIIC-type component UlaA
MLLAAETLLFSPDGIVTLTALKKSGTSVTVGSLAAAITVRVIAGGAGVVCAAAEAPSAIAPSESASDSVPVVLNRMMASPFNRWLKHHTRFFRRL